MGASFALLLIAATGLFQFIKTGLSVEIFKHPEFYIIIAYRVIIIILTYNAVINITFDKFFRSERVQNARNQYMNLLKIKDIHFKDFIKVYNHKLKKEIWKQNVDEEIQKLNRKIEKGKDPELSQKEIENLEKKKDETFMEAHWSTLPVKWSPIYDGDFIGDDTIVSLKDRKTHSDYNKTVAKFASKKIGRYLISSAAMGMIVVNWYFNGFTNAMFWLNLVCDIGIIVWRSAQAASDNEKIIDLEYTNVYNYKSDILKEYIIWIEENHIEESNAHKVIAYLDKLKEEKD